MKPVKNRPYPGFRYKINSTSQSFIDRYGEDSEIYIECNAQDKFGKCFMRKKDLVIKFYRDRLSEISDIKGEVFYGRVTVTIDSSPCLAHESEIGDETRI